MRTLEEYNRSDVKLLQKYEKYFKSNPKATFQYDCVSPRSLEELEFIIAHAREITYRTFRSHVDEIPRLEPSLKQDYAVSFYKSKLFLGKIVYFYKHSGIEYIYY